MSMVKREKNHLLPKIIFIFILYFPLFLVELCTLLPLQVSEILN